MLHADSSDPYFENPAPVCTVSGNRCVAGITVLDGELYVARSQCCELDVYAPVGRAGAYLPVRQLDVQRLRQPTDVVASQTATVVYVADAVGFVFVVDPSGNVYSRFQVRS